MVGEMDGGGGNGSDGLKWIRTKMELAIPVEGEGANYGGNYYLFTNLIIFCSWGLTVDRIGRKTELL